MTLEEAAKRLVQVVREAEPEQAERQVLCALKAAKLVAYRENLMAARFHHGPMGRGLEGLCEGILRAIEALEAEVRGA